MFYNVNNKNSEKNQINLYSKQFFFGGGDLRSYVKSKSMNK